ncbi:hypothetical protein, partial [Lysinibacillus sp. GbtcB16]|uniref:hypothetical protein n=1 Tax=Lysinibacillus sp. GbtcB16 TaxID=2824761 RepID=UPI001C30562D
MKWLDYAKNRCMPFVREMQPILFYFSCPVLQLKFVQDIMSMKEKVVGIGCPHVVITLPNSLMRRLC